MCVCALWSCVSWCCPQFDGTWMMSRNTGGWILWKTWPQAWFSSLLYSMSSSQHLVCTDLTTATERTHRQVFTSFFVFCSSHVFFIVTVLYSPLLSLFKWVFLSCLTVQFAPKDIHVVSMFFGSSPFLTWLSQSPTWPTNTLTSLSPGSQRNFHQKATQTKSNRCSFTRKSLCCTTAGTERKKQQTT